jgi:hypothetical protein
MIQKCVTSVAINEVFQNRLFDALFVVLIISYISPMTSNYKDVETAPRNHNSILHQSKFRQSSSHFCIIKQLIVFNALFWYLIVIKYHQSFLKVLRGKQIKLNNKFIRVLRFVFWFLPRVGVLFPMHIALEYIRNSLDFCADWGKFLYYNPILTHIILV